MYGCKEAEPYNAWYDLTVAGSACGTCRDWFATATLDYGLAIFASFLVAVAVLCGSSGGTRSVRASAEP